MDTEETQPKDVANKTREHLYFWGVLLLGMGLWIFSAILSPSALNIRKLDVFMFFMLNILAEQTYVMLPQGGGISASFAMILAGLLLFNTPIAVFIAVAGALITMGIIQQRPLRVVIFNAAQYALTYSLAGLAMGWLSVMLPAFAISEPFTRDMILGGLATAIYLVVNLPLVNGYMLTRDKSVVTRQDFLKGLMRLKDDLTEILQTLFFYPIAVLVAYSYGQEHNPMIPLVLTLLVFGSLRFIEQRRRIETQREKTQHLYDLTRKMAESALQEASEALDPGHVFNYLFDDEEVSLEKLIHVARSSIYRVEWQGDSGRIVHQRSEPHRDVESSYDLSQPGILQTIAHEKRSVLQSNMSNLGKTYEGWRITYQRLMAEPILVNGKVMFILVMFRKTGRPFQEEDQRLIKLLVNAFEITLKNIELRNRIQAQAIKDGLMNIYNHRYLKSKLEEEVARSTRYHVPLSMIITDVDYFKKFNDTHGHLLGDQVLREMAQILTDSVRETDIVARYGGEELAILLPETPLEPACEVAERIRKRVASHTFRGKDDVVVSMSLSIGVSCLIEEPDLTASELITRTDTALYRAKHQGRNQICQAVVKNDNLVIQTYSQGTPPQPADQNIRPAGILPRELQKTWQEHHEKSLPELQRALTFEVQHAGLNRSMIKYFEKQILPMVPEILMGLVTSEITASKQLHTDSDLHHILQRLKHMLPQRLPRKDHLMLLQHLLLRVYRHFLRQALSLPVAESERKNLFNHSFRLIMVLQNNVFTGSLEVLEHQWQQQSEYYAFARTLLQSLPGGPRERSERLHVLARSFPEAYKIMLLTPHQDTHQHFHLASACPTTQDLPRHFILKEHADLTPRSKPILIEIESEDLSHYLETQEPLRFKLSHDTFWVLAPLWNQQTCHGILILVFDRQQKFEQHQQHMLLRFAQDWADLSGIELAQSD